MFVEDVGAGFFEGFVDGILDDDQDLFSKKSLSIAAIFQSNLKDKERHISAMKANAKHLPTMSIILADGGKWNVSTTVKKDHEGNTSGSADLRIEKKGEGEKLHSYVDVKAEIRKDKDQKVETGVSFTAGVGGEF
jgi:hypothetical protein